MSLLCDLRCAFSTSSSSGSGTTSNGNGGGGDNGNRNNKNKIGNNINNKNNISNNEKYGCNDLIKNMDNNINNNNSNNNNNDDDEDEDEMTNAKINEFLSLKINKKSLGWRLKMKREQVILILNKFTLLILKFLFQQILFLHILISHMYMHI